MPEFNDKRLTPPDGAQGTAMQISAPIAPMHDAPHAAAERVTEALHGEYVCAFREEAGFTCVQLERDRYVGWVESAALSETRLEVTHKIAAIRTYAYSAPDLKSAPACRLPHGAWLNITGREGRFLQAARAGWVPEQHVVEAGTVEDDPAAVAERFLHAPYLWGGCDSVGVDCTGLVQAAYRACGATLPRDSDMQYGWAGDALPDWQMPGALRRGDLVFWKGHVGIMLDAEMFLHANAHHMAVAREPLSQAIERIEKIYGEPIGARRINVSLERSRVPDWRAAQG